MEMVAAVIATVLVLIFAIGSSILVDEKARNRRSSLRSKEMGKEE